MGVSDQNHRFTNDYDVENIFTNHSPTQEQVVKYESLRAKAKEMAVLMGELCPRSRELSLARTHLEQAVFWANGSIARHE